MVPVLGLYLANGYFLRATINSTQKGRKKANSNFFSISTWQGKTHGKPFKWANKIFFLLFTRLCLWLEIAIYLFKESSWVLADLDKSRNDIIQVDVTQGGVVPALPLHLV